MRLVRGGDTGENSPNTRILQGFMVCIAKFVYARFDKFSIFW